VPSGLERVVPTHDLNGRVRFTTSGSAYLVFCHDQILTFYHLETQQLLRQISIPPSFSVIFQHCGWLNEDTTLLAIEDQDHSIQLWDVEQEQTVERLIGHNDSIRDMDFHSHKSLLASVSENGTINVWDLQRAELKNTYYSSAPDIWEILLNPQLSLLAVVNGEDYIELWDIETGKLHAKLAGHDSQITLAFSPNGKLLASGSDDCQIKIWSL
jgi:WD40 repeat protein